MLNEENTMATPEEMLQTMIKNLPEKTGKSLEQWLLETQKLTFTKHGEFLKYLKQEHGVSHGFANLIASKTLDAKNSDRQDDPLLSQYAGPKAELKPIYDRLITHITNFGSDVEIAVKKSYVSLRRNKQFAIIQASTRTRVDLGLQLPGVAETPRLESSGSFNQMVTHRVRIESLEDIDCELIDWLELSYDRN
jgi:predicted transport protein